MDKFRLKMGKFRLNMRQKVTFLDTVQWYFFYHCATVVVKTTGAETPVRNKTKWKVSLWCPTYVRWALQSLWTRYYYCVLIYSWPEAGLSSCVILSQKRIFLTYRAARGPRCFPSQNHAGWYPGRAANASPWHRRGHIRPWSRPCPNIFQFSATWPVGFGTKPESNS